MKFMKLQRASALLVALSWTTFSFAQYVWLDEKGVKQYSDMAPPRSVPNSRILKAPGIATRSITTAAEGSAEPDANTAASASANAKLPMTTAEKNTDFNKRQVEQAEKEKKSAEDVKRTADKTKNCERAREYQRTLDSGQRITRNDKNGERSFMSDEQRTKESRDTKKVLTDCQ